MSKSNVQRWASVVSSKPTVTLVQKPIDVEKQKYLDEAKSDIKLAKAYTNKITNARQSGKVFAITFETYKEVMTASHCFYSGQKFTDTCTPTLERINPFLGYELGNVVAVTNKANQQKSLLDEFLHQRTITDDMKLKLLRKATYQIEKKLKNLKKEK